MRTALASALIVLASRSAHAEKSGVRLSWSRAPLATTCVGAKGLEEDVRRRLAFDPFTSVPVSKEIEGVVTKTETTFEARFVVRNAETGAAIGERTLKSSAASCASLSEAIAVAVTLAIDPTSTAERSEEARLEPILATTPPEVRATISPPTRIGGARAELLVVAGLLPSLTVGAEVGAHAAVSRKLDVSLAGFSLPETRTADLGFSLAGLRATASYYLIDGRRGAAELSAGFIGALFSSYLHPSARLGPADVGTAPWLGAEAAGRGTLRLFGPLAVSFRIGAIVPISRKQAFVVGHTNSEWEQEVVALVGTAGLALRWDRP